MNHLGKKLGTLLDLCVSSLRRAMLIFSVPFQFYRMIPEGNPLVLLRLILTVVGALHTAKQSQIPADRTFIADGHISPNAPDLFRPPKLSRKEPA